MYLLKLYHQSAPDLPVAAHVAMEGRTRVGRDPAAEWVVPDPDREVSRTHFELTCAGGALYVTPLGTNGVFTDADGQLAHGEAKTLGAGDAISFGPYKMIVEAATNDQDVEPVDRTILAAPFGNALSVPTSWPEAPLPDSGTIGDALLDAFCRGADLDVSTLSGEDAADLLFRAGEIYRQMVLGLADLVSARSTIKQDHRLKRTTISAEDNNPFKWAPSRRLASDLLLRQNAGFLGGPEAAHASFADIKSHMLATLAGYRAVIEAALDAVQPATIEARVKGQKSLLQSQGTACWSEFCRAHAEFRSEDSNSADGPINRAFTIAYETCLREIK